MKNEKVSWLITVHAQYFFNLQEKQILLLEDKGLFTTFFATKKTMIKG